MQTHYFSNKIRTNYLLIVKIYIYIQNNFHIKQINKHH